VIGVGRVGSRVAKALQFLGASVRGVDPYLDEKQWQDRGVVPTSYKEGIAWANCLTYHCPLFHETFHYFGKHTLAALSKPVWLINASRGGIVDEDAVGEALENGLLLGVALDVFQQEPWPATAFSHDDRVIITPHIGAFSEKAKQRMALETLAVWREFTQSGRLISAVEKKFCFS
jgi:D-3-phosphoglycerate dehydrogenase